MSAPSCPLSLGFVVASEAGGGGAKMTMKVAAGMRRRRVRVWAAASLGQV
ncbi:MAG: hypothetical protein ACFB5Z_00480 [Elainellaceae cyanobacterium]